MSVDVLNGHILVVDDHQDIRDLVAGLLAKEGYRVSAAADGRQMRRQLIESSVDLVVLDLMLPGEDGLVGGVSGFWGFWFLGFLVPGFLPGCASRRAKTGRFSPSAPPRPSAG